MELKAIRQNAAGQECSKAESVVWARDAETQLVQDYRVFRFQEALRQDGCRDGDIPKPTT